MDATRIALAGLIDDAGLFPPGSKPMPTAIADHLAAQRGPYRMLSGRFLCRVSRFEELAGGLEDAGAWTLGAILDGPEEDWIEGVRNDLGRIADSSLAPRIEALELRLPTAAGREAVLELVDLIRADPFSRDLMVFAEITSAEVAPTVATIAAAGDERLGAKLRLGGLSASAFPDSARVAAFVEATRASGVRFKATAGLHHPFRTFDPDLGVLQHGFLNLLGAVALVDADPLEILDERDPSALVLDPEGLSWRQHHADADALKQARALFTAFGSCSFDEPVDDLLAAGVLAVAGALPS